MMSADRVRALEKLYTQEETSDIVDMALEKLFTYELRQSQQQLERLERNLSLFEQQHDLSSEAF